MANIVLFGASGRAGHLILAEAVRRGHQVTAVGRAGARPVDLPPGVVAAVGDPTSSASVRELAPGADVFIVAIGGADDTIWKRAARTLVETLDAMPGPIPRILHMGGGASLLTSAGTRFLDAPDFPTAYRGPASGQAEALDFYRRRAAPRVSWTYVSPPPVHFAPGSRRGHYRTGTDHPVVDEQGQSSISYEDFALALIDEVEKPRFPNTRMTVGY